MYVPSMLTLLIVKGSCCQPVICALWSGLVVRAVAADECQLRTAWRHNQLVHRAVTTNEYSVVRWPHLGKGEVIDEGGARLCEVGHVDEVPPPLLRQLHDGAHKVLGSDDLHPAHSAHTHLSTLPIWRTALADVGSPVCLICREPQHAFQ